MEGPLLMPNMIIESKWKGKSYKVIKMLGKGGTARVYMVMENSSKKLYAMKISSDNLSLNREFQLLQCFSSIDFIVKAYEIDDVVIDNQLWHFLLLEYIDGVDIKQYIEKSKLDTLTMLSLIIILLEEISKIHILGYILGDLKLENIMLDSRNKRLRLIDMGGAVKLDSPIKEYTPAYDRASWGCGERKAEPSYDQFTLIMIMIRLLLRRKLNPQQHKLENIIKELEAMDISLQLTDFIKDGLYNKDISFKAFTKTIKELYNIEGIRRIKRKEEKKERIINKVFVASTVFLIITGVLILSSRLISYMS